MTRVLIVGAGPAGMRAAETLAEAGLHPVVVDEAARAGGQIYRRPPEGFTRPAEKLYGSEAAKARRLHALFDRLVAEGRVTHLPERSVLALSGGVAQVLGAVREEIAFDRLILATGATDRLAPVPGWESAGVYTLGAAQIALKAQGVALGRRIVLAGSGPLLTLLATQLRAAGAEVAAVLDTAPMRAQIAAGAAMARARPQTTLRGLRLRAALGRRYHAGVTLERIETADGPVAMHWRDARGRARRTACDMVGLGWHLRADTHLADLAGARFDWSEPFRQWLPRCDALGRAGDGFYVAGDGQRLLGADGAEEAGRAAAIACLQDLGLPHPAPAPVLRRLARMERFAHALARAFPWPAEAVRALPDATVVCRCENISAGLLRETLPLSGAEANRAKSLSRVGMGRCQGRYCQLAGAEIVAASAGRSVAEAGRLRAQPPARPAPIGAWLATGDPGAE
ncbi:FAD/NAD(P)-binding oxidoreductase [Psychromarinibacter sp. C21-152]|uniref:FAD/NAD(P)-binding oxidoreductase n=1 Tax=Psychromarinibacter sediminicola TaxID=3033385 RepID=A0AAE3NP78_9RHOB|nr:FAD/NAD(P)-binding oxidoreductase [Psychromarinibacter sediminicola]MDF0600973.1 FAD/NAD(P)-binding oxidoreductase [Psychromarinibacter sediminicola]